MNNKHFKYFNIAKNISKHSTHPRVFIGAVVVDKNNIIGMGTNLLKSHPIQRKYNKYNPCMKENQNHFIHAEISAIVHTGNVNLEGCSIYIYRENKLGHLANCRPCPACMTLIKTVGIKKIFYTTEYGYCEETITN